ncbi:MAG: recombinase RecX [Francisellaceae bacterium]|nr:recombinase RecX [Francisellaceae bacterium]
MATIYSHALALLTRREHGLYELKEKLLKKKFELNEIEVVLECLVQESLQSDERFTESFIRTSILKGQGFIRIKMELNRLRIDPEIIDKVIKNLAIDWQAIIRKVYNRRFKSQATTPQEWQKQMRFLLSRGFSSHDIKTVLKTPDEEFEYENE